MIIFVKYFHWWHATESSLFFKSDYEIISATKQLGDHPEKFQFDEFYPDYPGNIRRFYKKVIERPSGK
jgi:hypothetical protein